MPGFVVLTWLPILYAGHLVCSCLFKTLMAIHVHVALKQQDCVAIGFFSYNVFRCLTLLVPFFRFSAGHIYYGEYDGTCGHGAGHGHRILEEEEPV